MRHRRARRRGAGGFSVIEMVVVSFLMVVLSMILSAIWWAFCLPALDVAARCQTVQEANLAASALARDCGGYFSESDGSSAALTDFRYNGCQFNPDGSLQINFQFPSGYSLQGSAGAIFYKLDGNQLVRSVGPTGPWTTVATGLTAFTQADPVDGDPGIAIRMTFLAHGFRCNPSSPDQNAYATYTLVTPAADPS